MGQVFLRLACLRPFLSLWDPGRRNGTCKGPEEESGLCARNSLKCLRKREKRQEVERTGLESTHSQIPRDTGSHDEDFEFYFRWLEVTGPVITYYFPFNP